MKVLKLFAVLLILVKLFAIAAHSSGNTNVKWGYGGKWGPLQWANLSHEFAKCGQGKAQSPIDLKWSQAHDARQLTFMYKPTQLQIVDDGQTIKVSPDKGSYLLIDGRRFDLLQFHFHAQSEHTFSGHHFPLEAHFVHKNDAGQLAVVGVMFKQGHKNDTIAKLWQRIPAKMQHKEHFATSYNPIDLIPAVPTHYHYMGSLTTPPCSENVNWTILNTPLEISREQIDQFEVLYRGNNRPVQRLNGRVPASF